MLPESYISDAVIRFFENEPNTTSSNLSYESSLIDTGIIDSLSLFRLVVFIENQFSVSVHDEDITIENFETIKALVTLVKSKLNRGVNSDD